ncbi:ferrous iron transport protein B [Kiritimatiella glycovorans]|uniref:ferrous iron transport protein B n=1 Tax=Kiritimatiella glycovorans TaxID=1307763 RepID=UPI000699D7AC
MKRHFIIAIAGNPNSGKTTLFNALTGSRHRVGNWPGVTVDRVEGYYECGGCSVRVVDLPGIYSFSASSVDEHIAREYVLREKPDAVINIVDATNLERNLYLTTQLIEMRVPVVVALNKMDEAGRSRLEIEVEHLARHLDSRVVPTVALRGEGLHDLRSAAVETAREARPPSVHVHYEDAVEEGVAELVPLIEAEAREHGADARWWAVKLLEGDDDVRKWSSGGAEEVLERVRTHTRRHTGDEADIVIADGRYGFIHGLARDVVKRHEQWRRAVSDHLDAIVLNRVIGVPIFLAVMYLVFLFTIKVGEPFIHFFDRLCGAVFVEAPAAWMNSAGAPELLTAVLTDGVGGGLQILATFIPPIFFIFLCLSLLEESGYMARAGFVMDRWLRVIGLPGKAFIPLLIGFGCNVPGILATRTLDRRRDRIMTALINPFMSCGGRLPVYTLFAVAFFPGNPAGVVFALYLTGIALAVVTGLLFKRTIFRGEAGTFVMELPPYHLPAIGGVLQHAWRRLRDFIVRAGQVILIVVIILSVLSYLPSPGADAEGAGPQNSLLSETGRALTPVFRPMGIRD